MSAAHTLLIVDDSPEDREVYRDFLSDDPNVSYQFLEAPLAEVGLSLFEQQQCDAILLDFHMPDMNGLEFLAELQRHLRARQTSQRQPSAQHYGSEHLIAGGQVYPTGDPLGTAAQLGHPPIIMLTGEGSEAIAVKAIKQGIQDYLVKQHLQPEVLQLAVRNVIQQSQLHALVHKQREQQRLIATTALRIRQSLDLKEVLETAVAEVQQLLECDHVAVYQQLSLPGSHPKTEIRAELGKRHTLPTLPVTSFIERVSTQESFAQEASVEDLTVPISITNRRTGQSELWGYLVAHQQVKRTPWQPDEQSIFKELAVQLAIAIQQSALLSDAQSALKESQELNHFKSRIISTVSHEYRTPLAVIMAAASTLERHSDRLEPSQKSHYLKLIQTKSKHMATLIDDVLMMHQCDLNEAHFEPAPINLLEFVADLVEEHRELTSDKHEIVLKISGRTHGFWGDRGMLRFIFGNILSNAVKYSPDGGPVEVNLEGKTTNVSISIQDQGIGIPAADQPNLFESFSRASNVGTISGTGLGLSIAKACVALHSGEISIESTEGKGTIVYIDLPKEPNAIRNVYQV